MTCQRCNNSIGSQIQSHEDNRIKGLRATERSVRLQMDGVEVGATLSICKTPSSLPCFKFKIVDKMSNPQHVEKTGSMVNIQELKFSLFKDYRYDKHLAPLTSLYSAYLFLFHIFGYQWVIFPQAKEMRRQFEKPDEEIWEPIRLYQKDLSVKLDAHVGKDKGSLMIVYEPIDMVGFLIGTPQLEHTREREFTFIPMSQKLTLEQPFRKDSMDFRNLKLSILESTHLLLTKECSRQIINIILAPLSIGIFEDSRG